jgi:HlyD family secretion protein
MKLTDSILPVLAVGSLLYATTSIVRTQPVRELTEPPVAPPRSAFQHTIAAAGLIEPSSEPISLGTARSGVVKEVLAKVGDAVKKDQPLVILRTSELEAERAVALAAVKEAEAQLAVAQSQITVAEAQMKIAEAEVAQAQRMLTFAESVKDSRVLSDEERTQRAMTVATQQARLESTRATVASARSSVTAAEAACQAAQARVAVSDVEIERCTIKAPLDSEVLQVRIRVGEYVSPLASAPWFTLGQTSPLHIRADVDEHEAWRVQAGAKAEAQVRGNPALKAPLNFVRFEPYVVPKKSLTGDASERVDTRVLQVIYRIEPVGNLRLFPGQQMDVFIEAPAT